MSPPSPPEVESAENFIVKHENDSLREAADALRARDAAIRAQARAEALEEAAAVAKQSQDDCFCVGAEEPCSCCLEAARIEGYIRGLRDRALAQKAGGE